MTSPPQARYSNEAARPPSFAVYEFVDLTVDCGRRLVFRGSEVLAVSGLSFDLLVVLLEGAPNMVTIDELMGRVWPGVVVNPETISQRVKLLRHALGDDARAPRYIAVVRGRGYRAIAAVSAARPKREPQRVGRLMLIVAIVVALLLVGSVALAFRLMAFT